jgi:hypothetical protein
MCHSCEELPLSDLVFISQTFDSIFMNEGDIDFPLFKTIANLSQTHTHPLFILFLTKTCAPHNLSLISFGKASVSCARLSAGATVDLTMRVLRGECRNGAAIVRPPGHHAEVCVPFCPPPCLHHLSLLTAHSLTHTLIFRFHTHIYIW